MADCWSSLLGQIIDHGHKEIQRAPHLKMVSLKRKKNKHIFRTVFFIKRNYNILKPSIKVFSLNVHINTNVVPTQYKLVFPHVTSVIDILA